MIIKDKDVGWTFHRRILSFFLRERDALYGDMGIPLSAKEDVDDFSTPCVTYTLLPNSSDKNKSCKMSLLFEYW